MGIIKHRCIYENETTSGYVMCTLSSDYGHYGTQTCRSVPLYICERWKQRARKDAERIWKEQRNECKHNEDGECFSKWDCVYKQADLNPDGTVNIYKCGKEQKNE